MRVPVVCFNRFAQEEFCQECIVFVCHVHFLPVEGNPVPCHYSVELQRNPWENFNCFQKKYGIKVFYVTGTNDNNVFMFLIK